MNRIALLIIILAFGCTEETEEPVVLEEPGLEIDVDDPIVQRILDLGFSESNIEAFERFYLVEGDITFSRLQGQDASNGRTEQVRNDAIVSCQFRNINVFLDAGSFSEVNTTTLGNALNDVITEYNRLNLTLRFTRVFNSNSANMIIGTTSTTGDGDEIDEGSRSLCGRAEFPRGTGSSVIPGRFITIFEEQIAQAGRTQRGQLALVIAHEIGHAIGLRHTDDLDQVGGSFIPNTPSVDPASIMNSTGCGNFFTALQNFSAGDRTALNILYSTCESEPVIPLRITSPIGANPSSPVQVSLTGERWTLTWNRGTPVDPIVDVDIYVNNRLFSSERISNSGHMVRTTPTGFVRVVLKDSNDTDQTNFHFTFTGNLGLNGLSPLN